MKPNLNATTKYEICNGLRQLGVKTGSILEVHSSLSRFGHVEGGAETVLAALFETVGKNGTIIMSTHLVSPPVALTEADLADGLQWKVKLLPFDDLETRSGMGVISDTFRKRADVVRWNHPIYSVSAWGKDAAFYCQGFKPLIEASGEVLLMGVEMDRCSCLHLAEDQEKLPQDIRALIEIPESLRQKYPAREWSIGYGPGADFCRVQEKAEKLGMIKTTEIGQAKVRLFDARPMVELYKRMLNENPYELYGFGKNGQQ